MNISNLDIASTQWNNWAYNIVEAGMMFDGDNLTNAQGNTYRNWYPISTVKSEFLQDGKLKQELFPGHKKDEGEQYAHRENGAGGRSSGDGGGQPPVPYGFCRCLSERVSHPGHPRCAQ